MFTFIILSKSLIFALDFFHCSIPFIFMHHLQCERTYFVVRNSRRRKRGYTIKQRWAALDCTRANLGSGTSGRSRANTARLSFVANLSEMTSSWISPMTSSHLSHPFLACHVVSCWFVLYYFSRSPRVITTTSEVFYLHFRLTDNFCLQCPPNLRFKLANKILCLGEILRGHCSPFN